MSIDENFYKIEFYYFDKKNNKKQKAYQYNVLIAFYAKNVTKYFITVGYFYFVHNASTMKSHQTHVKILYTLYPLGSKWILQFIFQFYLHRWTVMISYCMCKFNFHKCILNWLRNNWQSLLLYCQWLYIRKSWQVNSNHFRCSRSIWEQFDCDVSWFKLINLFKEINFSQSK